MGPIRVRDDVAAALAAGEPVVALESTLVAHGFPRPRNMRVARDMERVVVSVGAVPATIAVIDGVPTVGLDDEQLGLIANRDDVVKAGVRDLGLAMAQRRYAATTVAATAHLAAQVGIRVFATGGLGGVHRDARDSFDESADLLTLARTPITVVCAGVKSILDVAATLERLETLGVPVLGYRTGSFPGFYLADSGHPLAWRADEVAEVAAVVEAQSALGLRAALVVANPVPVTEQLDPQLHDEVLADGLRRADREGVHGHEITPFLLAHLHRATGGATLDVNSRIIIRNAVLAAKIAVELAESARKRAAST